MKLPTIYIIRHGQSQANLDDVTCGFSETDLTELGKQQAAQSGEFLRSISFSKAFVSSLRRTRQTYEALDLPSSIEVAYDPRLREVNLGEKELMPEVDYAKEGWDSRIFADNALRIPGGESLNDVKARMSEFISDLKAKTQGTEDPVLIVSHGGASRVLLMLLDQALKDDIGSVRILNCEVWKVEAGNCQRVFTPNS